VSRVITCPNEMVALSAAHGYAQITGRAQAFSSTWNAVHCRPPVRSTMPRRDAFISPDGMKRIIAATKKRWRSAEGGCEGREGGARSHYRACAPFTGEPRRTPRPLPLLS